MSRPEPRSSIAGSTALEQRNVPRRFVSRMVSHVSTGSAQTGLASWPGSTLAWVTPALFTRTSTGPKRSVERSTRASTAGHERTSTGRAAASPVGAVSVTASTAAARRSSLREA